MFERANYYIRTKRNLPTAKSLLERYLKAPLRSTIRRAPKPSGFLKQAASLGA